MDRIDLFRVYDFGHDLHGIRGLYGDTTVGDLFFPLMTGRNAMEALLSDEPAVKLSLARDAATELRDALNSLYARYFYDHSTGKHIYPDDPKKTVQSWEMSGVRLAMQNFDAVFRVEMRKAATYMVPKKGTYDTADLVDQAEQTFSPRIRSIIGEQALTEYKNAGRCFAFALYSAAGYHACRAVEVLLRAYYRAFVGADDARKKVWGELIDDLEGVETGTKPDDKTIAYLKSIKDFDRNPLMHVRVVLSLDDADVLLSSAKIVMTLMAEELAELSQEKEVSLKVVNE